MPTRRGVLKVLCVSNPKPGSLRYPALASRAPSRSGCFRCPDPARARAEGDARGAGCRPSRTFEAVVAGAVQAALAAAGQRGDAGEAAPHGGIRAGPGRAAPRKVAVPGAVAARAEGSAGCERAESRGPARRAPRPARLGSASLGSAPLLWAPLGSAQLSSARLASARLGWAGRRHRGPPAAPVAMETQLFHRGGRAAPPRCATAGATGGDTRSLSRPSPRHEDAQDRQPRGSGRLFPSIATPVPRSHLLVLNPLPQHPPSRGEIRGKPRNPSPSKKLHRAWTVSQADRVWWDATVLKQLGFSWIQTCQSRTREGKEDGQAVPCTVLGQVDK